MSRRNEVIREALVLLILAASLWRGCNAEAAECWRPPVAFYPPPTYTPPVTYYPPPYYVKEYVPHVLEEQVYKDRYYSLSDLYRDRLYVEAFDMLRDMRQRTGAGPAAEEEPVAPRNLQGPALKSTPRPLPERKVSYGKTSDKAKEVLNTNCFSCHAKGNEKLDLSDLDAVTPTKRWAAFGMAAAREMPKPPADKTGAEREKWKSEHGLKDEEMNAIFDGWVNVKK